MWGVSSPDDKLADDLGNAVEAHESAIVGRGAGQFGTFATKSALVGHKASHRLLVGYQTIADVVVVFRFSEKGATEGLHDLLWLASRRPGATSMRGI